MSKEDKLAKQRAEMQERIKRDKAEAELNRKKDEAKFNSPKAQEHARWLKRQIAYNKKHYGV